MKKMASSRRPAALLVIVVSIIGGLLDGWLPQHVLSTSTTLIKIDGSSTVFPVTEAVAEEFQKETRGSVRVTVGISGTGGGFKKFCRGET
ncbi:MAG: protein sphX, partial [Nitrospira sp.]